jgi:SMODS and SLOG-associating 2TM effector domain 1
VTTPLNSGRIPYRIRIGVTGHRDLESSARLRDVLARVPQLLPGSEATPVRLSVVSALAEGADRVVVDEVFDQAAARGEEARLEVVLPFERERYVELQEFSAEAKEEFERWLDRATSVVELGGPWGPKAREASYQAAGQYVVNRCDVLVALWDGQPSGGRGGTAETLLYAAELGKPCIWIPSGEEAPNLDNLDEHRADSFLEDVRERAAVSRERASDRHTLRTHVLKPLHDSFRELDGFNRLRLPPEPELRQRIEDELGAVEEDSTWITGPFVRASVVADRYQKAFTWTTWLMSGLATAAAVCLGVSLAKESSSTAWVWAEVACLLALVALFVVVHRLGFHRRWLSYRLLAERFRSAYFMAPTGIDFRRTAGLDAVFVEHHSADWLLRAFEEVWDSRPNAIGPPRKLTDDEVDRLKHYLAEDWIGGQIAFHAKARRRHQRHDRTLTSTVLVLFFGTVVVAIVHAFEVDERIPVFLSVTLPVAAAAIGVILTVRQHRALAERYERMHADLISVQRSLLDVDAQTISKTASEAARVIAEENGDWFGAMWFLDVEHPP